jgi:hypothetical protein
MSISHLTILVFLSASALLINVKTGKLRKRICFYGNGEMTRLRPFTEALVMFFNYCCPSKILGKERELIKLESKEKYFMRNQEVGAWTFLAKDYIYIWEM